jgi:hypothetical protein
VPEIPYVFLLGAGASKKAGVLLVDEMTELFQKRINEIVRSYVEKHRQTRNTGLEELAPKALENLKESILSNGGKKFDVEILLEALSKLADKDDMINILRPVQDVYSGAYPHLKIMLMSFIREVCERMGNVDYLRPLKGFSGENGLDIFTLNYDGTVEAMCEKFEIPFCDGFSPNWNPNDFGEGEKARIRIYKIHGSLFWFKTRRSKYIKLPIKDIDIKKLHYFTDEDISETIIYPLLTKEAYTGPFPWLIQEFRNKLLRTNLCIVIGYSFRDESIRKIVFEQMESNPELWLYLVNPHATEVKKTILDLYSDFIDRIVTLDLPAEDALEKRVLVENLKSLNFARQQEEQAMMGLLANRVLNSDSWQGCLFHYREVGHFDRIRSSIEEVMRYQYKEMYGRIPIQWMLIDLAIRFGFQYFLTGEKEKARLWLTMFRECWAAAEHYGEQAEGSIPADQLPDWYGFFQHTQMAMEAEQGVLLRNEITRLLRDVRLDVEIRNILQQILENLNEFCPGPQRQATDYRTFVRDHGNRTLFSLSTNLLNRICG